MRGQSFGARGGGWIKCINILRREGGREEGGGKGRQVHGHTEKPGRRGGWEYVMAYMMASLYTPRGKEEGRTTYIISC